MEENGCKEARGATRPGWRMESGYRANQCCYKDIRRPGHLITLLVRLRVAAVRGMG